MTHQTDGNQMLSFIEINHKDFNRRNVKDTGISKLIAEFSNEGQL